MKERALLPGSGATAARRSGRMATGKVLHCGTAAIALMTLAGAALADVPQSPNNLFGSRGIIAIPSARMAPDGELYAGASFLKNNQHYNLGFQALPWLEASFRYSGLQHFQKEYPVYYDRAFGLKVRLWDEIGPWPAVALGIDDIVGTGVYTGEYLVASKRFGDVDASLGIGWGRRAGTALLRNPLALVAPSFNDRKSFFGQAGGADFEAFFHGRHVGVFGGAVWTTPIDGLSVLVEYDSDNYALERSFGNFTPKSQVNYGLSYAVSDNTLLGLDWLYGRTLGGSLSFRLDPVHPQYPQKIETPPPALVVRSDAQQQQAIAAAIARRDPRNAQAAHLFESRNAIRNDFIDALWRQDSDYADVRVQGASLDLSVTGSISSSRCAATARLMQGVAAHISQINLHDPDGRRRVVCAVPRSVEGPLISAAFLSDSLEAIATPAIPVATIDASSAPAVRDSDRAKRAIRQGILAQNISVEALSLNDGEALVYYRNFHFLSELDAVDRMVRVLSKEAPVETERFRLINVNPGIPLQEFNIQRGAVERSYQQEDGSIFSQSTSVRPPAMNQQVLAAADSENYPRFQWGIFPQFRQSLFDPNQPFGVQLVAAASGGIELARGWTVTGSVDLSLYDDFDTSRASDSLLPHVRSDFLKYFTQGKNGIGYLTTEYRTRLAPTMFVKLRAGYLESMFAGAGGEILWRPEGARWSLGADVYEVWQRDFNRLLGLQSYRRTTGHISLYYDSPWYDLNFQLRAGQYLAGDRGVTFQITRRFSTGVEIGAFVTKTNVSAAQFGEGSFDKGIIIRIPLGWAAPLETQSQIALDLRPVQRDGGQPLFGDAMLYDETRSTSEGELLRHQPMILSR